MQQDQQAVSAAQQQLAQAAQADPNYSPATPPPSDDAVTHAKSDVSAALAQAATTTRTATAKGNSIAAAAHQAADAASQVGGC